MNDARAFLQRRHRLALWERPLWIVVAALVVDIALVLVGAGVGVRMWMFVGALVVAILARLFFHPTLHDTARALDAKAGTRNRLETLATLGTRDDALARAIEKEATGHLARQPLPRPYVLMSGLGLLAGLGLMQLVASGLWEGVMMVSAPVSNAEQPVVELQKTVQESSAEIVPTLPPTAALRWIEPLPAIVATANESVPLLAESDCAVGLTNLKLRLTIDGEPYQALPQAATVDAGLQSLTLSLDLAALGAKPFSFVTYHLTAERNRSQVTPRTPDWSEVVSLLQVIQIRPVGGELSLAPPPEDAKAENDTERLLFRVRRLKLAQLDVLRTVFALAHDMPARTSPDWTEQIQAVTSQQRAIWQEMTALIPVLGKNIRVVGAAGDAQEALQEIQAAWDTLIRAEPANAFAPADRSLAGLGGVEKFLTEAVEKLREEKRANENEAANPVRADATFQLPSRDKTPAGQIETLARLQQELADQLAEGTAKDAFIRQDAIARALPKLAAHAGLSPEIQSAIKAAATDTKEAAQHLNERDLRAAIEPATRAAQTLQAVVAALDTTGRVLAVEVLTKAQRAFNAAALSANEGDFVAAARAVNETQRDLQDEALRQQNFGSAPSAQQLSDLSGAIDASRIRDDLSRLVKQPTPPTSEERAVASKKLTQLAQRAADARKQTQSEDERAKDLEKAADELRRAQANAQRAAKTGDEELKDLFIKAQENAQQTGQSLSLPPAAEDALPAEKKVEEAKKPGEPPPKETDTESLPPPPPPPPPAPPQPPGGLGQGAGTPVEKRPDPSEEKEPSPEKKEKKEQLPEDPRPREGERKDAREPEKKDSGAAKRPESERKVLGESGKPGGSSGENPADSRFGKGGLSESHNREKYGRVLSAEIGRVVTLVAEERRRLQRSQVLITATPAEAPPAYRPAVANYFESLARAGTKQEPPPKPVKP